jgi:hypothetical protein
MQDTQPSSRDNLAASHEAGTAAAAPGPFVITKEHRRFAEFADAVRRDRYIGLCYGPPGVGKTLSARQYAGWDIVDPHLQAFRPLDVVPMPQQAMASRTIVYTPKVCNSPRLVDKEVTFLHDRLSWGIEWDLQTPKDFTALSKSCGPCAELLIVDEADRLKTPALEQLRDHHDRTGIGLILIGMPGIESAWPATPSSTAGSDSSTTTGRYQQTSWHSSWPVTGPSSAWTTPLTSPRARRSPRSPGSPAATSA